MPIYEFVCEECNHLFEELLMSAGAIDEVQCPDCGSPSIRKKLSLIASSNKFGGASTAAAACTTSF
ncbi:MAG: zinc ribbon domain-containing protein [Anaerolineales bacterium]|nr:zinc ribbon domain-containing protein [Anaerolineales bacterium]